MNTYPLTQYSTLCKSYIHAEQLTYTYVYVHTCTHKHAHTYSQGRGTVDNGERNEHTSDHLKTAKKNNKIEVHKMQQGHGNMVTSAHAGWYIDDRRLGLGSHRHRHGTKRREILGAHAAQMQTCMQTHAGTKACMYCIRIYTHAHTYFCIEHKSSQLWRVPNVQNQDKQRHPYHSSTCRNAHAQTHTRTAHVRPHSKVHVYSYSYCSCGCPVNVQLTPEEQ